MRYIYSFLLILLIAYGGWRLYRYWESVDSGSAKTEAASNVEIDPKTLDGLPPNLETSLAAASQQGPAAFRRWLDAYSRSVQDPRLAWIQLDYVVMAAGEYPGAAKQMFDEVKNRLDASSPVYPRMKQLEKTFQ